MRLHSLTLRALGPFPGEHRIDFAALGASGLFLLEGPTGAGKSTVIDAVVFALYGRPAAAEASPDRLVSGHAAPGVRPVVDLVLETAAGVFRVQRSPEHRRPKLRGSGTTSEPATVRLWRLSEPDDEAGEPLSTRVGEADAELARIVGLSREQFVQTVVLPQGEFAAFLRATPEQRRPVLQRLFGTDVYQRMQDHLAEAARVARRSVDQARGEVRTAIASFVRTARAGLAQPAPGPGGPAADEVGDLRVDLLADRLAQLEHMAADPEPAKVRALVDDVTSSLREAVTGWEGVEALARVEESAARAAHEQARTLDERLRTRDRLLVERSRLAAEHECREQTGRRLAAARRAAGVIPVLEEAVRARAARADAVAEVELLVAGLVGGPDEDLSGGGVDLVAVGTAADRALGAAQAALALERRLPRLTEETERGRAALADLDRRREEVAVALAARPAERADLDQRLASLREAASAGPAAALRLEVAEQVLAEARAAARADAELAELTPRLRASAQAAREAVDHEARLRRRRIAGAAAELAGTLRPGEPCAVCGATEHPAPARPGGDPVGEAEVDRAEERRAGAEQALREISAQHAALTERGRLAREACGGRTPAEAEAQAAAARDALGGAERAAHGLVAAEAAVVEHDAAGRELDRLASRVADDRTAAAEQLAALERASAADAAVVAEARAGSPSVALRVAGLTARAEAARSLGSARRRADDAAAAAADVRARTAQTLAAAGFGDEAAARAVVLDAAEHHRLEADLERYRVDVARVDRALAAAEDAGLEGAPPPDAAGAARRLGEAAEALSAGTRGAERARAHLAAALREATALDTALTAEERLAHAAGPTVRLANLATAGELNERRTPLATYVLLRRFEDVVAAANVRLGTMSGGRFALARIDEREGGVQARRAGLGLVVEDHLTGQRRNPRTLSGGETFYVSLCLALGLADVVRAESGGIDLGTLFVDEGFGSLDPETLDAVLGELGRLREGGRVVGIVSHVSELKQRIPERIEVRRCADGSSTLTVRA